MIVFGQRGGMTAAASSSSAAADLPHPQMLPSSHERYKTGTRVWMVTANREKGKQVYVKADVYRTEETGLATRVSMREVEGTEVFAVVVPHQAKALPHGQQTHEGFTLVERAPRDQSNGNTAGQHVGLFDLLPDVERDVFFALLGPGGLARLRRTSTLGSQRVSEAYVKMEIDAQLVDKSIQDIISSNLASVGHSLRFLHIVQQSGDWAATEVYDGRCEALRQLSLIGRHLGVTLQRVNGEERLGGSRLTVRPLQTLPADHPFRDGYDEASPVCEIDAYAFASVRDAVLYQMRSGGSRVAGQYVNRLVDAPRYDRLHSLATQPPPIWGCHTISTSHWAGEAVFRRMMVLQGDQPSHTFEAHLYIYSTPGFADAYLWTTERRVAGKEGAARFPQTVKVVREVMGAAEQALFGNQLAVELD
ncbi:unnamed protein product [Vitrella brassicaformis CCMP3155]|uniref:Uncharacterized protein n=1 Tax=Vitrella brassicaformis (strain CCMP3155) TaxID=1169540 RepID=A0A0G4EIR0_VITBC|nr:unnamed protein product [Vitrella brassicaformis CCMP3155]|eukprot:CEL95905.1 unnamed protein product [Vitrella brassicaformis CCMP3155]